MGKNLKHAEIGKLVREMISKTGQKSGLDIEFELANDDAKRILKEAEATIKQRKLHKS